jgi:hypothetical protein
VIGFLQQFDYLPGRAALGTNRADEAKARFEQCLAARPGSIEAHLALGRAYFGWWERDAFNIDRIRFHPDSMDDGAVGARKDNLYEVGAGLVWGFAPKWSLRPEILWIRDQSNVFVHNYSSTEVWLNLRYAF